MSYRRRHIEVFSMSMLDTVTCGLGGAIILMLYMASRIPPAAELIFDELPSTVNPTRPTQATAVPPADVIAPPIGLLNVTFFPRRGSAFNKDVRPPIAEDCSGVFTVKSAVGYPVERLFDPSVAVTELSLSVWIPGSLNTKATRPQCVRIIGPGEACTFLYVTDGYSPETGTQIACPSGPLEFDLLPNEPTYVLR